MSRVHEIAALLQRKAPKGIDGRDDHIKQASRACVVAEQLVRDVAKTNGNVPADFGAACQSLHNSLLALGLIQSDPNAGIMHEHGRELESLLFLQSQAGLLDPGNLNADVFGYTDPGLDLTSQILDADEQAGRSPSITTQPDAPSWVEQALRRAGLERRPKIVRKVLRQQKPPTKETDE